jgi:hypothetical protein
MVASGTDKFTSRYHEKALADIYPHFINHLSQRMFISHRRFWICSYRLLIFNLITRTMKVEQPSSRRMDGEGKAEFDHEKSAPEVDEIPHEPINSEALGIRTLHPPSHSSYPASLVVHHSLLHLSSISQTLDVSAATRRDHIISLQKRRKSRRINPHQLGGESQAVAQMEESQMRKEEREGGRQEEDIERRDLRKRLQSDVWQQIAPTLSESTNVWIFVFSVLGEAQSVSRIVHSYPFSVHLGLLLFLTTSLSFFLMYTLSTMH